MPQPLPVYAGIPAENLIKDVFRHMDCGELHRLKEAVSNLEMRRILTEAYKRNKCLASPPANIPTSTQPPPAPRRRAAPQSGGRGKAAGRK